MLSHILHALLLLPTGVTRLLLNELLSLLPHLDALNRIQGCTSLEHQELHWPKQGIHSLLCNQYFSHVCSIWS